MKANDFEMCGGGTPRRIHTVVCPHCHKVWVLSSVPSAWGCVKVDGGCGEYPTREEYIRVYAKDRERLLPGGVYTPKGGK